MGYEKNIPLGLQLSMNAYRHGGTNFSPLQGGIEAGEAPDRALIREASEEYGLGQDDVRDVRYLVSTLVPVSPSTSKATHWDAQWLHWFFFRTKRHFRPNPESVAQFTWCDGPDAVFDVMANTREEKLLAFAAAIAVAMREQVLPLAYRPLAELLACRQVTAS